MRSRRTCIPFDCRMHTETFKVNSPNVVYGEDYIESTYKYQTTSVEKGPDGNIVVTPNETTYQFKTHTKIPKLG